MARFDAAATEPADYARRHWGEVLLNLYLTRNNLAAYVALSEKTGLTAKDCHAIATMLVARRKLGEALTWVERGIGFDTTRACVDLVGHDLAGLRRVLLSKLGRGGEALESAWAVYRTRPSQYTYDDLTKFVPKNERAAWHEKAIDAIEGGDLRSVIELLLETKEMERLAERVRRSQDDVLGSQPLHHRTGGEKTGEDLSGPGRAIVACAGDAHRRCEEEQVLRGGAFELRERDALFRAGRTDR